MYNVKPQALAAARRARNVGRPLRVNDYAAQQRCNRVQYSFADMFPSLHKNKARTPGRFNRRRGRLWVQQTPSVPARK